MSEERLSISLGRNLKKYRKMKGLTQEDLARDMNTTFQTISNYECKGITDVDVERELSRVLGVDLRENIADKEGIVGEVGKEILFRLIENKGKLSVTALANELHGMSQERVNHEIEKIANLDMCVREKYVDFRSITRDEVFITAKGIITYKNLISDTYHAAKLGKVIDYVRSYEERLTPYWYEKDEIPVAEDMEDYINKRPWISAIYDIRFTSTYKADYIIYLYHWGAHERLEMQDLNNKIELMSYDAIFPGVNIYHDIIYRMAYGFDDTWRNENFFSLLSDSWYKQTDKLYNRLSGIQENDPVLEETINRFASDFEWIRSEDNHLTNDEDLSNLENEYEDRVSMGFFVNAFADDETNKKERYLEHAPKGMEDVYPDKWFSKEEIEDFIRKNYHLPQNDEEREIQKKIDKVEKLRPILKEYYSFPKEWEENGLADLVRELNGIK